MKIFCIIGETASGKDSIVKKLKNWFDAPHNLRQVVSCTTRKKRENETDGVEHYFLTDNEYAAMHAYSTVIAETQIGKFRYMATYDELLKSDIYIIDPNGLENFKKIIEMMNLDVELVTIYIHASLDTRIERGKFRGDDKEVFLNRVKSEENQFSRFRENKEFDYIIFNEDNMLEFAVSQVENIMNYELNIRIK